MSNINNSLAIDIGGTKISYSIYSSDLKNLYENTIPTSQFFQTRTVKELHELFIFIKEDIKDNSFKTVGISINCAIKDNRIILSSLVQDGQGLDIKKLAQKYFTFKKFQSDNDVYCMAKAEIRYGVGEKYKYFLYVNLGTGIRVVAIENKKILHGFQNLAGEISRSTVWLREGNKVEIADNILAGNGVELLAHVLEGKKYSAKEVFDSKMDTIGKIYATYLAEFLVQATYFYNPEAIIFGGSLIKSSKKWLPIVKKLYDTQVFNLFRVKNLNISKINSPALLGALL